MNESSKKSYSEVETAKTPGTGQEQVSLPSGEPDGILEHDDLTLNRLGKKAVLKVCASLLALSGQKDAVQ